MNKLYAKTVLYLYPCIDKVTEQIDELLLKKALSSGSDFSPCISQCEKMVELGVHNARLIELKAEVKKILGDFTEEENAFFGYRYFHETKKGAESYVDSYSRTYFRKQERALYKFAEAMEEKGFTDERFEEEYLAVDFIRELYRRVKIREENMRRREVNPRPHTLKLAVRKEAMRA